MRRTIFILSWVLGAGGAVLLYRGGADYFTSVQSQKEAALQWENQNPVSADSADAPPIPRSAQISRASTVRARQGDAIAKLSIPRLDTVVYVMEGTGDHDLKRGPGHLEGSVMPGAEGNCVIAGHRDTHFRPLKNIQKGDRIVVESRSGKYTYQVSEISVVAPENVESLQPASKGVLSLITCFPFDYVGSAPRRFIVRADLLHGGVTAL